MINHSYALALIKRLLHKLFLKIKIINQLRRRKKRRKKESMIGRWYIYVCDTVCLIVFYN